MKKKIHFLIAVLFYPVLVSAQVQEKNISENAWMLSSPDNSISVPAQVPGNALTDLYRNKKIPDPFFGENEKALQSYDSIAWRYETEFTLDEKDLSFEKIDLVFEGLDTYARIFLNDEKILKADNMFRIWEKEVKSKLKKGNNKLRVEFTPILKAVKELESAELPYTLPGGPAVFVRKSPYHFGWDWGPRFLTCGIWKPVKLRMWNSNRIQHIRIKQDSLTKDYAEITIEVKLKNDLSAEDGLKATIIDPITKKQIKTSVKGPANAISLKISNPKLWWCRDLGEANMYSLRLERTEKGVVKETKETEFGLRTMEWVQQPDSLGKSFFLKLNGKPVFAKGANIIPLNFFLPEVKTSDYEKLLDAATDANMNMLRVWGGGAYENDAFYQLCNRKGILVWQDFMFACAMYPGDEEFMENVEEEVEEQIIRLRNHPCLALWCGNNEIEEGWNNWGWQKQYKYSELDSLIIFTNYKRVFQKLIPSIVERLDGSRYYHSSSPMHGWGRKESLTEGDLHYWGVWWGKEPFDKYKEKTGRFVSEYGFQSLPDKESLKKFIPADAFFLQSPSMKSHQKHPTGYETITEYMERDYAVPKNLDLFAYNSQLVQADAMKTAIEAHRRAKPYCMGSLYWQLNDCWPAASWSSMDYYGNRKASHYAAKKAFGRFLISCDQQPRSVNVHLVSDDSKEIKGVLISEIFDFKGKRLHADSQQITIGANSSAIIKSIADDDLTALNFDSSRNLLKFTWRSGRDILATQIHYLKKAKYLDLKRPVLTEEKSADGRSIVIRCNGYLAKNIRLYAGNAVFSDNYFDLLPGESKQLEIKMPKGEKAPHYIDFTTLFDTIK